MDKFFIEVGSESEAKDGRNMVMFRWAFNPQWVWERSSDSYYTPTTKPYDKYYFLKLRKFNDVDNPKYANFNWMGYIPYNVSYDQQHKIRWFNNCDAFSDKWHFTSSACHTWLTYGSIVEGTTYGTLVDKGFDEKEELNPMMFTTASYMQANEFHITDVGFPNFKKRVLTIKPMEGTGGQLLQVDSIAVGQEIVFGQKTGGANQVWRARQFHETNTDAWSIHPLGEKTLAWERD